MDTRRTCILGGFYCQECGTPCPPPEPLEIKNVDEDYNKAREEFGTSSGRVWGYACSKCGGPKREGEMCERCYPDPRRLFDKPSIIPCGICGGKFSTTEFAEHVYSCMTKYMKGGEAE